MAEGGENNLAVQTVETPESSNSEWEMCDTEDSNMDSIDVLLQRSRR